MILNNSIGRLVSFANQIADELADIYVWTDEVEALFADRWELSFEDDDLDEDLPWDDDCPEN